MRPRDPERPGGHPGSSGHAGEPSMFVGSGDDCPERESLVHCSVGPPGACPSPREVRPTSQVCAESNRRQADCVGPGPFGPRRQRIVRPGRNSRETRIERSARAGASAGPGHSDRLMPDEEGCGRAVGLNGGRRSDARGSATRRCTGLTAGSRLVAAATCHQEHRGQHQPGPNVAHNHGESPLLRNQRRATGAGRANAHSPTAPLRPRRVFLFPGEHFPLVGGGTRPDGLAPSRFRVVGPSAAATSLPRYVAGARASMGFPRAGRIRGIFPASCTAWANYTQNAGRTESRG